MSGEDVRNQFDIDYEKIRLSSFPITYMPESYLCDRYCGKTIRNM